MKDIKTLLSNVTRLCYILFKTDDGTPMQIKDYQNKIIRSILYQKHKKNMCWATTRAGKSLAFALGIILLALLSDGRKIRIIAPTKDHTKIIMSYITQHILDHPLLINQIDIDSRGMGVERLRKEISKERITFKNNSEIMIITANISGGGRNLVGMGGTDIFIDETELIPEEIIRSKIMRMLGDKTDSFIFMISNPTRRGYMYTHKDDPKWNKLLITWKDCVREGRLTKEFVDDRRDEMTSIEFDIWYNSIYPEDTEDTLIKIKWLEAAIKTKPPKIDEIPLKVLGCDIARYGTDDTVLIHIDIYEKYAVIRGLKDFHGNDTMKTAGEIRAYNNVIAFDKIIVDDTGMGGGVVDRLKEFEDVKKKVIPFIFGSKPTTKKAQKRFLNLKAEMYFNLSNGFKYRNLYMLEHIKLKQELNNIRFEVADSSGKLKIIDPEKSPDFADALMMAYSNLRVGESYNVLIDKEGLIF